MLTPTNHNENNSSVPPKVPEEWTISKNLSQEDAALYERMGNLSTQIARDAFRGFSPYSEPHYDIADMRIKEPKIDAFIDNFVVCVMLNTECSYDEALSFFKLDEEARKHIRSLQIQWLEDMPYPEVTKKLWDLYYEPLAVFLDSLSETFAQYPNTRTIAPDIKTASEHILNAWEICKTRLQIDNSPKHTHTVADISNGELGKRVWMLAYDELHKLMALFAGKIQKDAEEDASRGRQKLAKELFATANLLSDASKKIEAIYSPNE